MLLQDTQMYKVKRKLQKKIMDRGAFFNKTQRYNTGKYICHLIETAYGLGRADAENKEWGIWQSNFSDNGWMDHTCTRCNYTINTDVNTWIDYDFCPGCGSPMRNGATFSEKYSDTVD